MLVVRQPNAIVSICLCSTFFTFLSNFSSPKTVGMPEWMDDNNENDGQMSGATFDQNGTFTGPSTSMARSNNTNNSNESTKLTSQSSSEEVTSQPSTTTTTTTTTNTTSSTTKTNEEKNKSDKSTPPRTDTAVVNVPPVSETIGLFEMTVIHQ